MGAATLVEDQTESYPFGTIFMAAGRGGYVGLVRIEDGRLDVAAALDPCFVRQSGGPGPAAARVMAGAGLEAIPALLDARWRGTPPLTRERRVEGPGLLVIGDAAGYVEPFTGEGMAWALASAAAAAPVAISVLAGCATQGWAREHRRLLARRHRCCRGIAAVLRHPWLARAAVGALAAAPAMAGPVLRVLDRSWGSGSSRGTVPEVAS
jgi:2-polyprenyl-6-methoxyphenol hydroxylase-like FAD-dependent oxidoreductase